MSHLLLDIGALHFRLRLESALAPRTCATLLTLLPLRQQLLQARWSGQAAWVPLGQRELGLGPENATSYPAPGELLLYPGGLSEVELLVPYGPTRFSSKAGQLAGNHCLTIVEGRDQLGEIGRLVLWEGAQPLTLNLEDSR